jgi:multiple sugar transport system ATP-binding protein
MGFLEIKDIRKSFGATKVLKGIDIEVEKGELLVLLGPSGCGKSTLLNMIAGLDTVDAGEIRIAGKRVNELHPSKRDIAMVFQSYALYPNMTVAKNIAFGMEMRKVPKRERESAVRDVAKLLQIEQLLSRKPSQLSGGRALVRDPQIFLFDEPLSNLDAKLRVDMRTEIKRLHQRLEATIVYVTHDQIEAMTLATRIAVMRNGELQQLGTPQVVYDSPANIFVAGFIGSPSMNLIPARLENSDGGLSVAIDTSDGLALSLPVHEPNGAMRARSGGKVIVGLRPETLQDTGAVDISLPYMHEAECLVEVTEPTGPDILVVMRLGGIEATARMRADARVEPRKICKIAIDMSKAVLFDAETEQKL